MLHASPRPRSRPRRRRAGAHTLVVVLVALSTACVPALRGRSSPARNWATTRDSVRVATDSARWDVADRWLAQFLAQHPRTAQAGEARLWRVLIQLEPGNRQGGPRRALALIDSLATAADPAGQSQLMLLRHIARDYDEALRRAETLAREIAQAREALADAEQRPQPDPRPAPEPRALAEEVRRLRGGLAATRDSLSKANAELERVRKRIAAPRP